MAPIGEQLKAARERKGLTLERVADETNIAKRYLAALEAEDFGVFPGDPYAIGFLRNYAEYLGLPSDELATSFKNMRIQEQPVPIQELIPRRGPNPVLVGAVAAGAVVVISVVLVATLGHRKESAVPVAVRGAPTEYRIEGAAFEKRLYQGDSLLVALGSERYKLQVSRLDDAVTLDTPVGPSRLALGEEGTIDLDRDGAPDLKLLVSDLSRKDPTRGAILKIEYASAASAQAAQASAAQVPGAPAQPAAPGSTAAPQGATPAAPATAAPLPAQAAPAPSATIPLASAGGKPVVLFESAKTTYPFVVSATFRGSCMFRYEVDKRDRDERYYRKGDTVTVNAQNSLRLWASNAQSVKLTVQASGGKSADLDLGGAGEVAVKRIAWTQGDSGGWILGAAEVD
jgi:cytoskeleton protein RodZ